MAMRRAALLALIASAVLLPVLPLRAQTDDDRYTIMRPEPWLTPKYQSPRGTRQHVVPPQPAPTPQPRVQTPPPIYVPETGRVLPNMPTLSGSGPGGAETSQDRASRCAHQAGVHGDAAGNRNAYIGSCINQ